MNAADRSAQSSQQLPLFPPSEEGGREGTRLRPDSSLSVALGSFEKYMISRGFTENTQQAFRLDMELLLEYLGAGAALEGVGPANLKAFLNWMTESRGVPCSPKTLERRITTLKVFFGWLVEEGILTRDPAAPLIHQSVSAPLPEILSDAELEALLATTQALRYGSGEDQKPDPRPHLLVTLVLHTGIKKGECVRIDLNHIDLTDPAQPFLWIRYKRPGRRHKERRISLPVWWVTVLREYFQVYDPQQTLFPWTARNLEYVLTKVAEQARVSRLTFEMLRWTCAARDYAEGMAPELLREKLGLSEITWYEVEVKLALLAQRMPKP